MLFLDLFLVQMSNDTKRIETKRKITLIFLSIGLVSNKLIFIMLTQMDMDAGIDGSSVQFMKNTKIRFDNNNNNNECDENNIFRVFGYFVKLEISH